jgi:hypothetical protein
MKSTVVSHLTGLKRKIKLVNLALLLLIVLKVVQPQAYSLETPLQPYHRLFVTCTIKLTVARSELHANLFTNVASKDAQRITLPLNIPFEGQPKALFNLPVHLYPPSCLNHKSKSSSGDVSNGFLKNVEISDVSVALALCGKLVEQVGTSALCGELVYTTTSNVSADIELMSMPVDSTVLSSPNLVSDISAPRHATVTATVVDQDISRNAQDHVRRPISVTAPMTLCLATWEHYLSTDVNREFLLDGIKYGFKIFDDNSQPDHFVCKNYRSATQENHLASEKQIQLELDLGRYVISDSTPECVSSIGAIPKTEGRVRLIHDMSQPSGGVNQYATETSVSFSTIDSATRHVEKDCFIAKIDLSSAY